MPNRIQIDGVWYVQEDAQPEPVTIATPVSYLGCVVENDNFVFDATLVGDWPYRDLDIQVTDKRKGNSSLHETTHWDNQNWMMGILEGNTASLGVLVSDGWNNDDIRYLQAFLRYLKDEKTWLTN